MKSFSYLCCAIIALLSCQNATAQTQRCHTMEYLEELKKNDPQLSDKIKNARNLAKQYLSSPRAHARELQAIITIPVVVHVMHRAQAIGTGINISDAQILSQFEVLNEDYRALNSDISNVPSHFNSVIGNPEMEFCLAQIDPEGNPTTGIDRVSLGAGGSWSDNLKPNTTWDSEKYLNIWVTEIGGGTLGYTTFPGTSPSYDGVVIDYRYFGKAPENPFPGVFDLGRTATHEIGHWLGLEHTFQSSCSGTSAANCSTGGDGICDTPPTQSANYGCSLSTNSNTCAETPVDLPDMWMNFLDYMDDACLYMFSQGQVDVMRAVLNTSRAGILNSFACDEQELFSYSGKVVDAQSGQGVANAKVLFLGSASYELQTDADGNFSSPNFRSGDYAIYAGKWGYMTDEFTANTSIDSSTSSFIIPIENGHYYDDFILDFGWTISGSASSGFWARDFPVGTIYNGSVSNPDEDFTGDFGGKSYVTGNSGGSAGSDDVDDGNVILTSPLFDLTNYNEPYISYYRWFFNNGGQGSPDDELIISITNGTHTIVIEALDANTPNANQWNFKNIRVKDIIPITATMQLIVETADLATGAQHLVEAGLDGFSVVDSLPDPNAVASINDDSRFFVYPNPASGILNVVAKNLSPPFAHLQIMSVSSKLILQAFISANDEVMKIDLSNYPDGVYFVKLLSHRESIIRKVTIVR